MHQASNEDHLYVVLATNLGLLDPEPSVLYLFRLDFPSISVLQLCFFSTFRYGFRRFLRRFRLLRWLRLLTMGTAEDVNRFLARPNFRTRGAAKEPYDISTVLIREVDMWSRIRDLLFIAMAEKEAGGGWRQRNKPALSYSVVVPWNSASNTSHQNHAPKYRSGERECDGRSLGGGSSLKRHVNYNYSKGATRSDGGYMVGAQ